MGKTSLKDIKDIEVLQHRDFSKEKSNYLAAKELEKIEAEKKKAAAS